MKKIITSNNEIKILSDITNPNIVKRLKKSIFRNCLTKGYHSLVLFRLPVVGWRVCGS